MRPNKSKRTRQSPRCSNKKKKQTNGYEFTYIAKKSITIFCCFAIGFQKIRNHISYIIIDIDYGTLSYRHHA